MDITFRTESGTLYRYEGGVLARMSERPVRGGYPVAPQAVELDELTPIEVGRRAVFWTAEGGRLTTSPVVEVLS